MKKGRLAGLLAIALTVGWMSGCQGERYERIDLESESTTAEIPSGIHADDTGGEEIRIETDSSAQELPMPENQSGNESNGESVRLLFGGDVLLSEHVLNAYQRGSGIAGILDEGYRREIEQADFFLVNEEFPFSDRGVQAADKQYTFRLSPDNVKIFGEIGIDGVSLANNHALDFGVDGLLDSCQTLDTAGILHTGAGADLEAAMQPVLTEQKGKRIAVIGATRVIPESGWAAGKNHPGMLATYDPAVLLEKIRELRNDQDYVIVFVHWGIERDELPQEYQRTLGQQYIDAGADLVIGSHPHVLQGIEYYKERPIVYSMGNFLFGSSIPRTMLLEVTLGDGEAIPASLRLIPGTSNAGYTRMLDDEATLQEFYQYMERISFGVTYGADGVVSIKAQP